MNVEKREMMAKFCTNCGSPIEENQEKCVSCGKVLKASTAGSGNNSANSQANVTPNQNYNQSNGNVPGAKSKVLAGLLGIFLGTFGVHNFYLGYNGKAVAQLLISVLSCCALSPISSIWGLVEGIMILTGSINTDAHGNPLVD